MEVNELLRKVRKVELKSRDMSRLLFSGDTLSFFKGRGMSFAEVREYQYSDDVRFIDWNVTARTGVPFVKVYEEERELNVIIMVDVSKSSYFGTGTRLKSELITEMSAVLAFSAVQNNDRVGLILFSDKIELYIPPSKGRNQILRIIREMVNFRPENKNTDIRKALRFLNTVIKKNSICFMLSDFQDDLFGAQMRIAGRKHDLIAIHIEDKAEHQLPDVGMLIAVDPETNEEFVLDTSDPAFRTAYQKQFEARKKKLQKIFGESKVDQIEITMGEDENFVRKLLYFFKSRAR